MHQRAALGSSVLLSGILVSVWVTQVHAQDVEPRIMTPAPIGTNFVGLTTNYSWGAILLDKTVPIEDVDGRMLSLIPSYSRFINVFGLTGRVDAVVPLATGEWDGFLGGAVAETTVTRSGLGDLVLAAVLILTGARAMTKDDFRDYHKRTVFGVNLRVRLPLGQYEGSQLINLGSNRWQFAPSFAISHRRGPWTFEAYAGVWLFTDNKDFVGGNVLSQDPMLAFQAHAGYNFKPGMWLTLGARQTTGGETSINGEDKNNPIHANRLGLIFAAPVGQRHTIKVLVTAGTWESRGTDFNTLAAQWIAGF